MMENGGKKSLLRIGTPLCGLVCGIVGVAIALALLLLGFWRTLFGGRVPEQNGVD